MTSRQNTAGRNMAQKFSGRSSLLFADFDFSCQGEGARGRRGGGEGRRGSGLSYVWHPPPKAVHVHPKTTFEREIFYKSLKTFYNSTIPLPLRGFAHPLISSRGQSHEYSIFSLTKTFNQKPYFLVRKCAKTHLQQCRISLSKFSWGGEGNDIVENFTKNGT